MKAVGCFKRSARCLMLILGVIPLFVTAASQASDGGGFIRDGDVKDDPHLRWYRWPTREQMRAALVPGAAKSPAGMRAVRSIREVIRSEVLPKDLPSRLVGLRHYLHGCDAIFVRYKVDNFVVQIVVTSAHAALLVRDTRAPERASKEQKLAFARAVTRRFFNESEALLRAELSFVQKGKSLRADNPRVWDPETMFKLRSWTETIRWWTNGELIGFWVTLHPGTAEGDRRDWFSYTYPGKPPRQKSQQ